MPDEPQQQAPAEPASAEPAPEAPQDELGEAGKRAIQSERVARTAAEKALKTARAQLEAAKAANQTEAEKAVAQAKAEGRAEALSLANTRVLKAEIRAQAAGRLENPALAVKLLDLEDFEVSDDGEVPTDEIRKAVDKLLEDYPALTGRATTRTGGDFSAADNRAADFNSMIRRRAGR